MSIKSIDIQSMYPKMSDVSKTQNDAHSKNTSITQQQVQSTKQDVNNQLSQVHAKGKTEGTKIKDEDKKKEGQNKKKKKKKSNGDSESLIDIKI